MSTTPPPPPDPEPHHTCRGCGNECQTEVCWCGDTLATHRAWYQGHEFVPYGCTCLFAKGADAAKPTEGE